MTTGWGALVLLTWACPLYGPPSQESDPAAFVTSQHAIYSVQEPIDVSFWVGAAARPQKPRFEIRNAAGRLVPELRVAGKGFAEATTEGAGQRRREGAIPAGLAYAERVDDLKSWYGLAAPGRYTIVLVLEDGSGSQVRSNALSVVVESGTVQERKIPLEEVWALDTPGTAPLDRLTDGFRHRAPEGRLVDDIWGALAYDPEEHPVAGPGFVVPGSGMQAVQEAHRVLVGGARPRDTFSRDESFSLVFFSYSTSQYVHVRDVAVRGGAVQVSYEFVPHETKETTSHFALIPLKGLPSGEVRVEMKTRLGSEPWPIDVARAVREIPCASFSFFVQ